MNLSDKLGRRNKDGDALVTKAIRGRGTLDLIRERLRAFR